METQKSQFSQDVRIGVFGIGYDVYWDQFPGLLDECCKKRMNF